MPSSCLVLELPSMFGHLGDSMLRSKVGLRLVELVVVPFDCIADVACDGSSDVVQVRQLHWDIQREIGCKIGVATWRGSLRSNMYSVR